jgi:ABC-type multidrug transport system ATPase subunit
VHELIGCAGEATILKDIELTVERGRIVGIVGERGSGKRQLLELISGLRPLAGGRIYLDSREITELSPRQRQSQGLECSLYIDPLFTRLWSALRRPTLIDRLIHKAKSINKSKEQAIGWLDRVGLLSKAGARINQISVGEVHRFLLAEMLISNPSVVLWDEPLRAFDFVNRESFLHSLRYFVDTIGVSFLITDRSGRHGHLFDSSYLLERGTLRIDKKSLAVSSTSKDEYGQVFISYSRQDTNAAEHFASLLTLVGARPWVDSRCIGVGSYFDSSIEEAILNSSALLALISPFSVESRWVLDEIIFAADHGVRVIPVLIEECELPLRLKSVHYLDWCNKFTQSFEMQATILASLLKETKKAPDNMANKAN